MCGCVCTTSLLAFAADIGPQGIVHGTTLTLLNAARKYLGNPSLAGKVCVAMSTYDTMCGAYLTLSSHIRTHTHSLPHS